MQLIPRGSLALLLLVSGCSEPKPNPPVASQAPVVAEAQQLVEEAKATLAEVEAKQREIEDRELDRLATEAEQKQKDQDRLNAAIEAELADRKDALEIAIAEEGQKLWLFLSKATQLRISKEFEPMYVMKAQPGEASEFALAFAGLLERLAKNEPPTIEDQEFFRSENLDYWSSAYGPKFYATLIKIEADEQPDFLRDTLRLLKASEAGSGATWSEMVEITNYFIRGDSRFISDHCKSFAWYANQISRGEYIEIPEERFLLTPVREIVERYQAKWKDESTRQAMMDKRASTSLADIEKAEWKSGNLQKEASALEAELKDLETKFRRMSRLLKPDSPKVAEAEAAITELKREFEAKKHEAAKAAKDLERLQHLKGVSPSSE